MITNGGSTEGGEITEAQRCANAAFIVLACNEHDRLVADNARLVEALQALLETDCPNKQYIHGHPFAELARTALATAVSAGPVDGVGAAQLKAMHKALNDPMCGPIMSWQKDYIIKAITSVMKGGRDEHTRKT